MNITYTDAGQTATENHEPAILSHALHLASVGWTIFPAPPGEKKSHKSAEHSNGAKWGATRDADQVRRDFERWPDANIGMPTGAINNVFVVDIDRKNGKDGFAALEDLEAKHGKLPDTLQVESPSGSVHYYFRWPGFPVCTKASPFAPGIDVRGDGGMVIAPPSNKPGAGSYKWRNNLPIAAAPEWLLDLVRAAAKHEKVVGAAREARTDLRPVEGSVAARVLATAYNAILTAEDGTRNDTLNAQSFLVGKHVGSGEIGADVATEHLLAACAASGLIEDDGERQCRTTIDSGLNGGRKEPAKTPSEMFPGVASMVAGAPPLAPNLPIERRSLRQRRINAASLAGLPVPDREWFVNGWIPTGQVTLVYGDGAVGKSLLVLMLCTCAQSNMLWFGHPVKQGPVEFITAEDSDGELHRRLVDIARETRHPLETMSSLHVSSFADEDAIMAALQGDGQLVKTPFYDEVVEIVQAAKPVLLVLDTLADIYGGNEVIRAQARSFVNMLRKIAITHNLAVVVLAHPSLDGMRSGKGTSGSTGWSNSVRSRLYLSRVEDETGREPDTDARVLRSMKMNYGSVGNEIRMRWRAGIFVPDTISRGDPLMADARADRVFLELLAKARAQNINVHVPTGRGYAPDTFRADASKQGVSYADLKAAMRRLLDGGRIENVPYGPPSRVSYRLQLAGGA